MGVVRDASVVDLFAGSGALGLEAWSRGAATVTFVERDRDAVAAIRANAEAVGLADPVVVVDDALRWSARAPELDLALADPPYEFDRWTELLAALRAAVVVAESDRELGVPAGYEAVRVRSYGRAVVSILRRGDPPASVDDGVHTTKG
jgi:16S rRNA (guanine966-N2)-methyltransferase